jgi:Na+/H+-dicarboxylate symporter
LRLNLAIALGLVLGLVFGLAAAITESPLLLGIANAVEPIGEAFVNLFKMVVIPLVTSVIFVGVGRLGDLRRLGRMGGMTLGFFGVTTVIAVLMGMGIMKTLLPLASDSVRDAITVASSEAPELPTTVEFLLSLIPSNPFAAAADGALLPLILFTVLLGAATGTLPRPDRERLLDLSESVAAALIKLVHWIMLTAPVGVFALAAPVTARAGVAMLQSLAIFVVACLAGEIVFISLIYLPAVRFVAKMPIRTFLKGCITPQIIAATTVSSPATVPAMLEATDKVFHASPTVAAFVVSLGAGLGRAGAALFQGVSIVFLAWLFDIPLPMALVWAGLLATFIVSFTVPSIPGGSIVSLAPAMATIGIPFDGMAVLFGIDRIPDAARTATNVTGTLATTVLVDRMESARVRGRTADSDD